MKTDRKVVELIEELTIGQQVKMKTWRLRNGSIELHKVNGSIVNDISFDKFEVVVGSVELNKDHIE